VRVDRLALFWMRWLRLSPPLPSAIWESRLLCVKVSRGRWESTQCAVRRDSRLSIRETLVAVMGILDRAGEYGGRQW
jgi:hypothetical protein